MEKIVIFVSLLFFNVVCLKSVFLTPRFSINCNFSRSQNTEKLVFNKSQILVTLISVLNVNALKSVCMRTNYQCNFLLFYVCSIGRITILVNLYAIVQIYHYFWFIYVIELYDGLLYQGGKLKSSTLLSL